MNLFETFRATVLEAVTALQADGVLPAEIPPRALQAIVVELPREAAHGDLSTNAAMVLAKPAKLKPALLAEKLQPLLSAAPHVTSVEVAGPGFINIRVAQPFWAQIVPTAIAQAADFGRSDIGSGRKVNVEYVSANPTGPLHVGHCRGAVFGDALASLLAFAGHDVTREYYINDAGAQVDVLARSAFVRYREALGQDIGTIPEGLYPGDYLVPVGKALAETHGDALLAQTEDEWLPGVRAFTLDAMMDMIRADLAALSIAQDTFFSEASLISGERDVVAEAIALLESKGLLYRGRLEKPKGEAAEDWEDREQLLFKATEFGDDVDRALVKSNGSYTYFASDIAYHKDKIDRGFPALINVFGADHGGYVKRLTAVVKALSDGEATLDIKLCQLVNLYRDGEPVRMSKRAGNFVTLRDVVDEVGPDAVRFMMLHRKNDAPLDFDFTKVTEKSQDNPVFYVQYAHARAHSILRNARQVFPDQAFDDAQLATADMSLLSDTGECGEKGELGLLRRLASYPKVIDAAAAAHEPHRIGFYLYDLASAFHAQWNQGKEAPHLRFIRDDDLALSTARLALVRAVSQVVASGLGVLGVTAPEEMR